MSRPKSKSAPATPKPGVGRPKAVFDLDEVEKLGVLQCTDADLAGHFGVETKTIQRHRENDPEFASALEKGKAKGRVSLRRMQMVAAQGGNSTMLVWLGKTVLGQRETVEIVERPSAVRYGWVKPKEEPYADVASESAPEAITAEFIPEKLQ